MVFYGGCSPKKKNGFHPFCIVHSSARVGLFNAIDGMFLILNLQLQNDIVSFNIFTLSCCSECPKRASEAAKCVLMLRWVERVISAEGELKISIQVLR